MSAADTGIAIRIKKGLTPYGEGLCLQRTLHAARCAGETGDTILFVEHSPVYTLGRSAESSHLLWDGATLRTDGSATTYRLIPNAQWTSS